MEVVHSSETLISTSKSAQNYNPEDQKHDIFTAMRRTSNFMWKKYCHFPLVIVITFVVLSFWHTSAFQYFFSTLEILLEIIF